MTAPPRRGLQQLTETAPPSTRRTSLACSTRLAQKERALEELEEALSLSQRRAATSTRKRNAEGRRAAGLQVQLSTPRSGRRWPAPRRRARAGRPALRAELDPSPPPGTPPRTSAGMPERTRGAPGRSSRGRLGGGRMAVVIPRRAGSSPTPRSWSSLGGDADGGGRAPDPTTSATSAGSPSCCARTSGTGGAGQRPARRTCSGGVRPRIADAGNVVVRDEAGACGLRKVHDRAGRPDAVRARRRAGPARSRPAGPAPTCWSSGRSARRGGLGQPRPRRPADRHRCVRRRRAAASGAGRARFDQGPHLVADEASGAAGGERAGRRLGALGTRRRGRAAGRTAGASGKTSPRGPARRERHARGGDGRPLQLQAGDVDDSCSGFRPGPGHRWDTGGWPRSTGGPRCADGTESGSGSYVAYIGVVELARGRGVARGLLRTMVAAAAAGARPRWPRS